SHPEGVKMQHAVHNGATVRVADRTDVSGRVTASSINDGSRAKRQGSLWRISDWEESPMTQLRRGVVGVIAAFVVVSLSFSAQAAEKVKITGTNKLEPPISRTVVSPGDDPKHELVLLTRREITTTSSDPDHNETEQITCE